MTRWLLTNCWRYLHIYRLLLYRQPLSSTITIYQYPGTYHCSDILVQRPSSSASISKTPADTERWTARLQRRGISPSIRYVGKTGLLRSTFRSWRASIASTFPSRYYLLEAPWYSKLKRLEP